jgi:hypothetical protein
MTEMLHSLRCLGFVGLARMTEATGLPESTVESELIDLAVAGLVTRVPGDFGGWGLTEAGRAADAAWVAAELATAGVRTAITKAYNDFLVLNPELLDLCTAWQLRPAGGVTTPNDHTDAAYDTRVLGLLTGLHQRADAVITDLSLALPRFERYRTRLTHALTLAKAGRLEYVTDDLAAYHTVWFQLHEDLLATLGIPR